MGIRLIESTHAIQRIMRVYLVRDQNQIERRPQRQHGILRSAKAVGLFVHQRRYALASPAPWLCTQPMPPDRSLRLTLNTDAHWPPHKCCKGLHDSVLDRKDLSGSAVCLVRNRTMEVLDTDIYAPMIPTPQDVCAASCRGRRRAHGRASLMPRPTSCMASRQRAAITMALLTGTSCGHLGRLQRRPRLQWADDDAGPSGATMARAHRQRGRALRRA